MLRGKVSKPFIRNPLCVDAQAGFPIPHSIVQRKFVQYVFTLCTHYPQIVAKIVILCIISCQNIIMGTIQQKIRDERKSRNLTQEEVAEALGISRASYIAIENGKRELRLNEKQKLEEVFGDSVEGNEVNYQKYRQMILEFLMLPEFKKGIPKTKLAKLLYLADFGWYYEHLESMSKLQYRKIEYGPVPDYYFRAIEEMYGDDGVSDGGLIGIEKVETADGNTAFVITAARAGEIASRELLSTDEKDFIKKVGSKWEKHRVRDIVRFTHEQLPYKVCRYNEIIPYSLITQEEPSNII